MVEKPLDIEIGEKMKALREKTGLSQREVAKITNMSNGYISRIESGYIPSLKVLKQLSEFYGINMPELFGEVVEVPEGLKEVGVDWITFAKDMTKEDMTPDKIKEYVEIVKRIKKDL